MVGKMAMKKKAGGKYTKKCLVSCGVLLGTYRIKTFVITKNGVMFFN